MADKKYAVILVRGFIGADIEITKTLKMLSLTRRNTCSIFNLTNSMLGMLNKARNYVTFGEVDEETLKLLKKKGDSDVYHMNSPKKGYGRKGIKDDFSRGGALGYRGEKINDLIKRMM